MLRDEKQNKDFTGEDDALEHVHHPARSRRRRLAALIALLAVTALAAFLFIYATPSSPKPRYDHCGTTADEARARGCVFETTGFAWLPKECLDPTTEREFLDYLSANNMNLYHDFNATSEVSMNQVRLGDGPGFFVRQKYHLTHCLFLIKKMHRAVEQGRPVDGLIMPAHHTEHCVHQLLQPKTFREHEIQFSYTKFPYCGRPGGYNLEWPARGTWTDF